MADSIAAAAIPHAWSIDALLTKTQRYAELMTQHAKDDWRFALWSSFTLELLLRSALARISPTLLADNKADWNHIYYALGHSPTKSRFTPRSIGVAEVAERLGSILPTFTPELVTFSKRHMTTRNEELHTGLASFDDLGASGWHGEYYATCELLLESLGKDLAYLFGADEAAVARTLIQAKNDLSAVEIAKTIDEFKDRWSVMQDADKVTLGHQALVWATRHIGHRVTCPSCGNAAVVVGSPAGALVRTVRDGLVIEKQHMLPAHFECVACGLKIAGLSYLMAAGLGDGFTGTTTFDIGELYPQEPELEPDFNEM